MVNYHCRLAHVEWVIHPRIGKNLLHVGSTMQMASLGREYWRYGLRVPRLEMAVL